jgi:NRPS condensation-like uncharacterized protein
MSRESTCERRVPFSVVDEAVHLLDNEVEPWSIQLEVRVEGHLDEARLRAALAEALARHPMARARKATSRLRDNRFQWEITRVPDLDPFSTVDCPDDDALADTRADLQSIAIPLIESPPLRVRLARHPDGDLVMLNVKHTAIDGFGSIRVLRSVARAYWGLPDPQPDLELEATRDLRDSLAAEDSAERRRRIATLLDKLRDEVQPTARLVPDGGTEKPGYAFHHASLSPETTNALSAVEGGTVNDVLLAALHLALAGWNDDHGAPARRIGVMLPVNLRPEEWWEEMAGNFSLNVRVATSARERESPEDVLRAIADQSNRIKKGGTGASLMEVLGGLPSLPVWAKQSLSPLLAFSGDRLVDTALLSNLGAIDEPPEFGPDAGATTQMWFSAPCRMPLGLSIGTVTVGGRLHVSYRYRHPQFDAEAATRFAATYESTIEQFIGVAAADPTAG